MATETETDFLTLTEACACFDPPVSWPTIRRWVVEGFFGGAVKLQHKRLGKRYFVTRAWCREFEAALNARQGNPNADVETPKKKKARVEKMRAGLRANGHKV